MMVHTAEKRLGYGLPSVWAGRAGSRTGSTGTVGSQKLCAEEDCRT